MVSQQTDLPCKDVGTEYASNDVPQVGDVVDVWEGTGDEDVSFPRLWEATDSGTQRNQGEWGLM